MVLNGYQHYRETHFACRERVSVQQFRNGVVLRMCCGLTLTLFVRLFDNSVATIPNFRFEF